MFIQSRTYEKKGQGHYDSALAVDPTNDYRIFVGGASQGQGAALYRCNIQQQDSIWLTEPEYIGNSVHADIHRIVFTPDIPNQMWVGCDGGVFFTDNPSGNGDIFSSRNNGLQTLSINSLGQHPTEECILFCGTQDNGLLLYRGNEAWKHFEGGDSGYVIVNWHVPSQILSTYTFNRVRLSNASKPYSAKWFDVPLEDEEIEKNTLFYAPLTGTPYNKTAADPEKESNRVAFGSDRVWISDGFGDDWYSIPFGEYDPNNFDNQGNDRLDGKVKSLHFASFDTLYAGTIKGGVYLFKWDENKKKWSRNKISNNKFVGYTITSIAVVPDQSDRIFVSLSGVGIISKIWEWSQENWEARPTGINVSHNAIVITKNLSAIDIYVGTDIGVWHFPDAGLSWEPFSNGLPDAAVLDLKIYPGINDGTENRPALLRAATHGRGVFEYVLDNLPKKRIELYIRDTVLDSGRFPTRLDGRLDPTDPKQERHISEIDSPDIKIGVPDVKGRYQFYAKNIDFTQFVDQMEDGSGIVPIHPTEVVRSRIYIQVHNRGIVPADQVRVTALIKLIAGEDTTPPVLPEGYRGKIQQGIPVAEDNWKTIGIAQLNDVRVGFPKVAMIDLKSDLLGTPDELGENNQFYLVIFLHHIDDSFESTERNLFNLAINDKKVSYKKIKAAEFEGTIPVELQQFYPMAGYVNIPASATMPEAPFDAFLAESLRINDEFFHNLFLSVLCSPLSINIIHIKNEEAGGNVTWDSTTYSVNEILQASTIILSEGNTVDVSQKVPLVWYANEKITINGTINAKGKGAQSGEEGDFGGSGGKGASNDGMACKIPISGALINQGGHGAGSDGNPPEHPNGYDLSESWASRALFFTGICKGGASGGNGNKSGTGGSGGGVVFLFAPEIELGPNAKIDVSGMDGVEGGGGGGGGLVVLVAHNITRHETAMILTTEGMGSGEGRPGGKGVVLIKTYQ